MSAKIILTERQKTYIQANYNRMTAFEIAENIKLHFGVVIRHMEAEGLERVIRSKRYGAGKDKVVKEGYFDVLAEENWVA